MSRRIQRRGVQVVHRDVEEPLNLRRMQVHRQHAVGAGLGDQVGDQLGADRRARRGLPVLPRVTEIRDHRGDPPRGRTAQRVQRDQQLHQRVVRREGGRLHHEDVLAADVLLDLDEHLHVGEAADRGARQRQVECPGHCLGERTIAVAGDDLHAARRQEGFIGSFARGPDQRLLATTPGPVHESAGRARGRTGAAITSFTPPEASLATTTATSAQ